MVSDGLDTGNRQAALTVSQAFTAQAKRIVPNNTDFQIVRLSTTPFSSDEFDSGACWDGGLHGLGQSMGQRVGLPFLLSSMFSVETDGERDYHEISYNSLPPIVIKDTRHEITRLVIKPNRVNKSNGIIANSPKPIDGQHSPSCNEDDNNA